MANHGQRNDTWNEEEAMKMKSKLQSSLSASKLVKMERRLTTGDDDKESSRSTGNNSNFPLQQNHLLLNLPFQQAVISGQK